MNRDLTDIEKAYLAGFFDAEGCVLIQKKKNLRGVRYNYAMHTSVVQVDKSILLLLQSIYGGCICALHDGVSQWTVTEHKAATFLKDILPYSRLKKPQIELALKFRDNKDEGDMRKIRPVDPERANRVMQSRDDMYHLMRKLKTVAPQ